MVRRPVACQRSGSPLYVGPGQRSTTIGETPTVSLLFASKDFPDARAVQADRLADFRQRRSGLLRSGEALAPLLPRGLQLPLVVKLGAFRLGEGFPFGVFRHAESLLAVGEIGPKARHGLLATSKSWEKTI